MTSPKEKKILRATTETELYVPVKIWLERQGYTVRGEVRRCDVVGVREGEAWPIIVELKRRFNLSLLLQAVDRLATSPNVYVAAEHTGGRGSFAVAQLRNLCLRLGLGLLTVKLYRRKASHVEMHCHPGEAGSGLLRSPLRPGRRTMKLLSEFRERSGDYNEGGSSGRKLVTAYREKALRCADALHRHGQLAPRQVRELIASDKAARILQDNVYGWFKRVDRGLYGLSTAGETALVEYAAILDDT
jgi:hypothetical protein